MKYFVLSLVVVFLSTTSIYAQKKGYVITNNHDTIYCVVKVNRQYDPQYQDKTNGHFHTIKPKNFSGYHVIGESVDHIAKKIGTKQKPVFVVRVAQGKIDLYQGTTYVWNDSNIWTITNTFYSSQGDSPLMPLADDGYGFLNKKSKQFFRDMIADQPQLAAKFDNDKEINKHRHFDLNRLAQYIKHYNSGH